MQVGSSSVLLPIVSPVTMIAPAHSRCSVNTGWKSGYFNHWGTWPLCLTNIWIFEELLASPFLASNFWIRVFHYRLLEQSTHHWLCFRQWWLHCRGREPHLAHTYFCMADDSGFHRWTLAVDFMLGNTNFEHQWSKMLHFAPPKFHSSHW